MTEPLFVIDKLAVDDILGGRLDYEVKNVEKNEGYLLTKDELEHFARTNHMYVTKLTPSRLKNVTWAWLSKPVRADLTGVLDDLYIAPATLAPTTKFDGMDQEPFLLLSGWLQKQLGRDVEVRTAHYTECSYDPTGPFRIHIWGSARGHSAANVAARIWDIPIASVQYRHAGILPVIDEDDSRVPLMDGTRHVAEIYPNALYINFDITRSGSINDLRIYYTTLQKAFEILNNKDLWPTPESISEKHRERFIRFVNSGLHARRERTKVTLEAAKQRAADLRQMWFEAEREVFALDGTNSTEQARERFAEEFMRLCTGKVEHISNVRVVGKRVIINIENITCRHPRTKAQHLLGNFQVSITPEYGGLDYIKNITRVGGEPGARNCHHPHVFDGQPCLGNIAQEVAKYIAHFEIEATCNLQVAYLQSCVEDHSVYLKYFPTI